MTQYPTNEEARAMTTPMYEVTDTPWNHENGYSSLIGQLFDEAPSYAQVRRVLVPLPTVCPICRETDGHTLSCPAFGR